MEPMLGTKAREHIAGCDNRHCQLDWIKSSEMIPARRSQRRRERQALRRHAIEESFDYYDLFHEDHGEYFNLT